MRQLRNFQTDRCYHLISRVAYRTFYLDEEEHTRFAETRTEAYVGGEWRVVARELRTHDAQGRVVRRENLAGQATTTEWDCCHNISETAPDGSATTWEYDEEDRMTASSRLAPLDMTEVAWLTTCHVYDGLGRETATWRTNVTANVGLPVTRTDYDQLGRVARRMDSLGNITSTEYSDDGRTVTVHNPNTSTRVVTRNADGDTLSVTGTAATPEFHTYGVANLEIASQTVPCRFHTVREGSEDSARSLRSNVDKIAKIFEIKEVKDFVKSVKSVPEKGFPDKLTVEFKNGDRLEIEMKR